MAQKITSRFFTIRRFRSGGFGCFVRNNQVGTIYKDGKQFWAFALKGDKSSDMFDDFASADAWMFQHYA